MPKKPPSLYELAVQQCIKYSAFITDIGELSYAVAKPFLAKVGHEQLALIEKRCPQIVEESDELWRDAIARVFKDRKLPNKNFRQTFYQYQQDKEAQLGAARERLRLKQEQYNMNKRATSVVALSESELPMAQRGGAPRASFNSKHMQFVARRAQANMPLRKPTQPLPRKFLKVESRFDPKYSAQQIGSASRNKHGVVSPPFSASTSPLGSPPMSPPPQSMSAPPPYSARSAGPPQQQQQQQSQQQQQQQPLRPMQTLTAKRKRVSSVFMPKR